MAAISAALGMVCGCGGGGSTPSGGGGGSPSPGTDMGSVTTVSDASSYTIQSASSGLVLGIAGQSQAAAANIVQEAAAGATDDTWHFLPMGSSQYNVENLLSHQVLGIPNASTSAGAQAVQYADNGTNDHLWQFYLLTDGNYLVKNVNSGLYLEVANSDATAAAKIDQSSRSAIAAGCKCQEWVLTSTGKDAYPAPRQVSGSGTSVHDPFLLQDPSTHVYWLYGTHQTLAWSTDGATFTYTNVNSPSGVCNSGEGGAWLTQDNRCPIIGPDFSSWTGLQTPKSDNNGQSTDVWAPDVLYVNGTYHLYYAIPYEPSTGAEAVIGLATSSTAWGPWTDAGYVISSWTAATTAPPASQNGWNFSSSTTWNAIDPAAFIDGAGNWWLVFGSWQDGIHLIQLDPKTGLRTGTAMYRIAARGAGEEGAFLYYWNGYYYYFASINVCCNGTASTYRTIVGRSQTVTGPYLDRGGIDLVNGGGTILISSHGNIYGPGGASVFTDTGTDGSQSQPTLVYHYYDGNNNGAPTLGINRLAFDADGWPYIE